MGTRQICVILYANLLGYLDKTKAEGSHGLVVEVEREAPEELGVGFKDYHVFNVTIRYEKAELANCAPDSEREYQDGKWVAEPAKWPALLEGPIPLPKLASEGRELTWVRPRNGNLSTVRSSLSSWTGVRMRSEGTLNLHHKAVDLPVPPRKRFKPSCRYYRRNRR